MEEEKIEKSRAVWPWIVGVVIVALAVYLIGFKGQNNDEQQNTVPIDLQDVKENNLTVAAFVKFMEVDTMKMELDNTFTEEALLKLVDATNAMAEEIQYDIQGNMEAVILNVNRTKAQPIETTNADSFREAADLLTKTVFKNMQQAKYPGLTNEVVELENSVASINPNVLILDQKAAIKNFFQKAADLLQKMN